MSSTPIAIIGTAYRAPSIGRKGLWEFLSEARSAWSAVPPERFQQGAFYHENNEKPGFFSSKGAHFLPDDPFAFDPAFFNITPDEARAMDPQHRMLLECALEASESAGLTIHDLSNGHIGVFAANSQSDYGSAATEDLATSNKFVGTGVVANMFANRLSYYFNMKGPSITVDAACASGSYALHLACQSIRLGECSTAFVGGSMLILTPTVWTMLDTLGALSPDGKCYSYDRKASGFGRGEGAGCMIIKRLDQALADGDPIHAIIRNTAVNHSGKTEGISMPSQAAQEDLLRRVHEEVGLLPSDTLVVEGHGTGTKVGDPIEANAVASALGKDHSRDGTVYLGSLKSNFGHLEGASGVLATIKAMMMVERGYILPTAMFEDLNPAIQDRDKLKVATNIVPWPSDGKPRRVCVSNFGFGGSNSIALLEEPAYSTRPLLNGRTNGVHVSNDITNGTSIPKTTGALKGNGDFQEPKSRESKLSLVVFSARSEVSLSNYLDKFEDWLTSAPEHDELFSNLVYTLGSRRSHFPFRFAVAADSVSTLKTELKTFTKASRSRDPVMAFAFTGQGAQYANMAEGLMQHRIFRQAIEDAESQLMKLGATWSLKEELHRSDPDSRINDAEISQPACTAIQIALVRQLADWGVHPTLVTGHSSGEIASAYAAGLLSFEAAIAVAYYRGIAALEVMRNPSIRGAMLALGVSAEQAERLISEHASSGYATIAAVNSNASVTVSGDRSTIEEIHSTADARGIFARRLKIAVAYHSQHMQKVASSYLDAIKPWFRGHWTQGTSKVVFISSVSGRQESVENLGPSYWVANLLSTVQFEKAIQAVISQNPAVIVEVGPHAALKNPIKQIVQSQSTAYLPTLVRDIPADKALLNLAGSLYTTGASLRLTSINPVNHTTARVLTDLPPYEWNKSVSYVERSRITQQKLHPGHDYHPLLGWKSPYSEGSGHSFRQILTLQDMPWIRGHCITGTPMFPMTAYICMAVAAFRAISSRVGGILIQHFNAKNALVLGEGDSIELITKLTPTPTGGDQFSTVTWSFEIVSWSREREWTTHCHGTIESDPSKESMAQSKMLAERLAGLSEVSLSEQTAEREYQILAKYGMQYEGIFKTMEKLSQRTDKAVHETVALSATNFPAIIDGFLHAIGINQTAGQQELARNTWVPVSFRRLHLPDEIPLEIGQRFTTITELTDQDRKAGSASSRLTIFSHDVAGQLLPLIKWDDIVSKTIARNDESDASLVPNSYVLSPIAHVAFETSDEVSERVNVEPEARDDLQNARDLEQVALNYLSHALPAIAQVDEAKMPSHLQKCVTWARKIVASQQSNSTSEIPISDLVEAVRQASAQGEMLCAVGEQLVSVWRGELQPLEIMLKDNMLSRNYEQDKRMSRLNRVLGNYVRRLVDADPYIRILEIGAGTGSSTLAVFEALSRDAGPEVYSHVSYTYTDISSGFFERARAKLSTWIQHVTFQKLDIGQDPFQEQGFQPESFDLILAGNVLHATPDMTKTMMHVRSLLRPGGRVAVVEATKELAVQIPFALLPGWWLADDAYRGPNGPLLTEEAWNRAFLDSGFAPTEHIVRGYDESICMISTTRAEGPDPNSETAAKEMTIWHAGTAESPVLPFAESLAQSFVQDSRFSCRVRAIGDIASHTYTCSGWSIFIDDHQQSIFEGMSEANFTAVHALLSGCEGLLWILPSGPKVESAIIKGMLRTLRQEMPKVLMILENTPFNSDGIRIITQLTSRFTMSPAGDQEFAWNPETKYIEVSRLRQLPDAEKAFLCESGQAPREVQSLWSSTENESLELAVDSVGSLDSLYFQRKQLDTDYLGDSIIVRTECVGMNFRDLLLVLGSLPYQSLGFEGAGVVTQVGPDVSRFQPGDRVFYLALGGAYATHLRIPQHHVCKMPQNLTVIEAASMPVAYTTAIVSLIWTAQLRKGETVLIHAASGAVGQACIILAQSLGAAIYVTAGTPEKREFLNRQFGIPMTRIFSSRTPDFREGILCATGGNGVDVVVNSLSGPLLQASWELLAEDGRFVEIGKKDVLQDAYLGMKPFDRNVTFSGLDLLKLFGRRPDKLASCMEQLLGLLEGGKIRPITPVNQFSISQMTAALRKLQSGSNIGKIVLTLGPDENVLAEFRSPVGGKHFRSDATYLISGGTGGIGRAIAPWMLSNGAGHVVLLGRSGATNPKVAELVQRYDGRILAMKCDVGSAESVRSILEDIKDLPRVRGVIHGALYLHDTLFARATPEDFEKITGPKIQGAWNLHNMCTDLDFFISLASFGGLVGNIGQAIYTGTSTFLDAFSEHRLSLGLHAATISLPSVLDVGYVAERSGDQELQELMWLTMNESQLQTTIRACIVGSGSGVIDKGKALVFMVNHNVEATRFAAAPYLAALHRPARDTSSPQDGPGSGGAGTDSLRDAPKADALPLLLEALMEKVALMTLMDKEDVEPTGPLSDYGLDSLVSVELRNWIRKETNVELALPSIVAAANLQALAEEIHSKM